MNVPVRLNDTHREARIKYLTEADFEFLQRWQRSLGSDTDAVRTDAVDFATLACRRFIAHYALENYARDVSDVAAHIERDPGCEVANLVGLSCDWFPESNI